MTSVDCVYGVWFTAVAALFAEGEEKRENMFQQLLRFIARPKKGIMKDIEKFKEKYFEGKKVVGIQVRTPHMNPLQNAPAGLGVWR